MEEERWQYLYDDDRKYPENSAVQEANEKEIV